MRWWVWGQEECFQNDMWNYCCRKLFNLLKLFEETTVICRFVALLAYAELLAFPAAQSILWLISGDRTQTGRWCDENHRWDALCVLCSTLPAACIRIWSSKQESLKLIHNGQWFAMHIYKAWFLSQILARVMIDVTCDVMDTTVVTVVR